MSTTPAGRPPERRGRRPDRSWQRGSGSFADPLAFALADPALRLYVSPMIFSRSPKRMITVAAAITAITAAGTVFAKDATKPSKSALPGVNRDYRIVRPMPEPDDNSPTTDENGWFKIGDTKVRISGGITVDVGAGSIPAPRH